MATIRNLLVRLGLDVSDTEKGVSQLQGIMEKVGAVAGVAGGVAIGAGLVEAMNLSSARGKLQAQLGVTAEESKRIGAVAGNLYAQAYGDSMETVNGAVKAVVQNMQGMRTASSAALQETAARAITVADVMEEDVGRVTQAVSTMMKSGLAKNSKEAFDVITRGTQLGGDKAQDLLDTFIEYSVQFKNMGLSSKMSMGILNQGLQAGARNSDLVADTIKEFSIEAVAGAPRVAGGFKSLGLSAQEMTKKFAAGGPTAAKALDLVFDKLRGIEDPAKRNAVAIELFGTKAEDMGAALFAIDPSKAVSSLGEVAGAADKAGKAMGETAASRFEAFKRSAMANLTGALDTVITKFNELSPETQKMITQWGLYAAIAAPAAFALFKIGGAAVSVAKGVGSAAVGTAQFVGGLARGSAALGENAGAAARAGAAVRTFGSFIGSGITATVNMVTNLSALAGRYLATGAAAAGSAAKTALFTTASIASAAATKVVAAATWLWNAALRANPIGIVITIIMALVAAIIYAYKNSETFRNIVQAVWKGIQAAISFAWNNVIKPAFEAIRNFIVNVLGPKIMWFHNNVVKPIFSAVGKVISSIWNGAIKPAFEAITRFLVNTLGPKFMWFHNTIVSPIMTKVGSVIKGAWNNVIKPVFDFLAKVITKTVPDAFKSGTDAIKRVWDKVVGIAKTPVNFVIGIYNNGIKKLVDSLASFVGISARLPTIAKFARGGVMPGYAPGKDTMIAAVSPGESIFRPEFTRAVGRGFVNSANAVARSQGPKGVRNWLSGPSALGGEGLAFARGGVVPGFAGHYAFGGIIGDFIQGVKDFTIGNVAKGAKTLMSKIFSAAVPGGGIIKQIISAVPKWISDKVVGWITSKVESGVGGPKVAAATRFAKAQAGKPYIWGGVGPRGYDCSGFMSAIQNVIRGRNPYSRLYSTHAFGPSSGPDGMVRNLRSGFTVGVTDAGVGHMAGTLGNMNVESRGSAGVVLGGAARGTTNGLFTRRYGLKYDNGGVLEPGYTLAYNGLREPEYVFTRDQLDTGLGGGGNTYHITAQVPLEASKGAVGREIVECIKVYESKSGKRWRGTT